jgi:hypothetical protein
MRSSAVTSLPYQSASVAGRFGKVFRPAASQNGSPAPTASSPWPPRGSSSPASVSLPPRACKRSCLGRSVAPSPRPPCQAPASFCVDAIGEDLLTDWPPQTSHRPRHDGHPACEPPRLVAPVRPALRPAGPAQRPLGLSEPGRHVAMAGAHCRPASPVSWAARPTFGP